MSYHYTIHDTDGQVLKAFAKSFSSAFDANTYGFNLRAFAAQLGCTVTWSRF